MDLIARPTASGEIGVVLDAWPHPLTADGRVRTDLTLPAGTTLERLIRTQGIVRLDRTPPEVLIDGILIPQEAWELTVLKDGQMVTVRAAAGLQLAIVAAATVVPQLLGLTGLNAALASLAIYAVGGLITNALTPTRPPEISGPQNRVRQPDPVFSLTGGANRARNYEPLPLVLGSHRLYPDLAAKEYTEYSGGEQYLNQIFNFGLGDIEVSDLMIGGTPLDDFEGVSTQWSDANGRITLVAGNVDTAEGAELDDTSWVSRDTPDRTNRIGIDLTGRIFRVDDDGEHVSHDVRISVRWRQGSGSWTTRTVTLSNSRQEPYRRTLAYDLPSGGIWTVQVRRRDARSTAERTFDEIHWSALRSYQPDTADYAGQTRLAVRIRATGQLNGRLDRLSGLVRQRIPTWDADAQAWSDDRSVSSNPAALLRWYARGVRIGGRVRAGAGLADARIDHAGLGQFHEWCEAKGLRCDIPLIGTTHDDAVHLIAQCGRGSITWQPGKLSAVWEDPDRQPSGMVSPGNIINGSFRVEYASGPVADEVVLRFIDPRMDWQQNSIRRTRPGLSGPVQRSTAIFARGVIDPDRAAEECNLQVARQRYHRRTLTWDMAAEGRAFAKGDIVWITHSLIDGGLTGRIAGGTAARIDLGRAVDLAGGEWILIRTADGTLHRSQISRPAGIGGDVREVILATPLPAPPEALGAEPIDALWRIHDNARPPTKARVIGVKPAPGRRFRFTAIDEVDAYFQLATSDLSAPFPVVRPRLPHVVDVQFSARRISAGDGGEVIELRAALTVGGDWQGGIVRAGTAADEYETVERLSGPADLDARWIVPVGVGQLVQIVPGTLDSPSGPVWTGSWTYDGGFRPAVPSGFAVSVSDDRTRIFRFTIPAGAVGVRIRYSETANTPWAAATELHTGLLRSSPHETLDPGPGTWHFQCRAFSAEGVASESATLTVELGDRRVLGPDRPRGWFDVQVSADQQTAIEAVAAGDPLTTALAAIADATTPEDNADGDKVTFRRAYTGMEDGQTVNLSFSSTWTWDGSNWVRAFPWIGSEVVGDRAITARNAYFESLAALDLQVRNVDIGEAIRAQNLNVDGRLVLNADTASFSHGKTDFDDVSDGVYIGRKTGGFAVNVSTTREGLQERLELTEAGLKISNAQFEIITGSWTAQTRVTAQQVSGAEVIPLSGEELYLHIVGGGVASSSIFVGGSFNDDSRPVRYTAGSQPTQTMFTLLSGTTVVPLPDASPRILERRPFRTAGQSSLLGPGRGGSLVAGSYSQGGSAQNTRRVSSGPGASGVEVIYRIDLTDMGDDSNPTIDGLRIDSFGAAGVARTTSPGAGFSLIAAGRSGTSGGAAYAVRSARDTPQRAGIIARQPTAEGSSVSGQSRFEYSTGSGRGFWEIKAGETKTYTVGPDRTITINAGDVAMIFGEHDPRAATAFGATATTFRYYEVQ